MAGVITPPPRQQTGQPAAPWVHLKREALKWSRTLHIYLSLSAFVMFLFFAITGVMLTHDSFGLDQAVTTMQNGQIAANLAKTGTQDAIVQATRDAFHIRLPLTHFNPSNDDIEIDFAGPAHRTQVIVERASGEAQATLESRGFVGMMADLHKGAETGWAWRGLLDVVSVWIALSSITGLIMLLALPKRRRLGLLLAALGGIVTIAMYAIYVPRS